LRKKADPIEFPEFAEKTSLSGPSKSGEKECFPGFSTLHKACSQLRELLLNKRREKFKPNTELGKKLRRLSLQYRSVHMSFPTPALLPSLLSSVSRQLTASASTTGMAL